MLSRDTDTEEAVSECWFLSLPPNKITNSQPGITSHISAAALKEAVTSNICGIRILNNNERRKAKITSATKRS